MEVRNNWLITGGCGFLGTSLIANLLKNKMVAGVRVLDNVSVGTREDLAEVCDFTELNASSHAAHISCVIPDATCLTSLVSRGVELFVGDIRDYETCMKACEGIDVVVHLAANTGVGPSVENPRADMEANVIGIFNILEASRLNKVDKFVFASSGAPIGEVEPPIHEEKAPRPVSPYGASKLAGEGYCSAYYRTFGLKTVSLRFGNVYGPRSKHKNSVVAKFIRQALTGETLEIYGDGNQTRDFIYIDDLINAIRLAVDPIPSDLNSPGSLPYGEVFQIATQRETTVNDVGALIKEIVEREKNMHVAIKYCNARLGDVKRNYSDISKARRMLGFQPETNLIEGLMETLRYFTASTQA